MTLLWIVAVSGALLALAALAAARRLSRRLAQLSELYWTLKYEHGELKARVKTLVPDVVGDEPPAAAPPAAPPANFVPLSAVRRDRR